MTVYSVVFMDLQGCYAAINDWTTEVVLNQLSIILNAVLTVIGKGPFMMFY